MSAPKVHNAAAGMRCSADGTFMARLTADSDYWWCRKAGCKEIRHRDPDRNFGLMLLGFCKKARRP